MNYTEIYNKIYDCVKHDGRNNEQIHYTTVSIANAINGLFRLSSQQNPQTINAISEILSLMWSPLKLGGFDIDDKDGQPFN